MTVRRLAALSEYEGALGVDEVVLVRGRVDHKDAEKTCIVVQKVEPFRPTDEEVEKAKEEVAKMQIGPIPFRLRVDAALLPATAIDELKEILGNFPGESDVVLEMATSAGRRTLKLGPSYRVSINASLKAELDHILGSAFLPTAPAPVESGAATAAA